MYAYCMNEDAAVAWKCMHWKVRAHEKCLRLCTCIHLMYLHMLCMRKINTHTYIIHGYACLITCVHAYILCTINIHAYIIHGSRRVCILDYIHRVALHTQTCTSACVYVCDHLFLSRRQGAQWRRHGSLCMRAWLCPCILDKKIPRKIVEEFSWLE
jgi:hypothetical protein